VLKIQQEILFIYKRWKDKNNKCDYQK